MSVKKNVLNRPMIKFGPKVTRYVNIDGTPKNLIHSIRETMEKHVLGSQW